MFSSSLSGLLIFVSLGFVQEQDPLLLPQAPDGWRFERLEFPLEFAPKLNLAGFEELQFAPGMFDPDSDSYFSYALAMRIREVDKVDAEFLKNLFQQYFYGLCEAVAGSKNMELDLSQIETKVVDAGERYQIVVQMYDPFVPGKPMTLLLDVESHSAGDGGQVDLLGIASPLPREAKIWKTLDQLRSSWKAAVSSVAVPLNHIFVIPDMETFDAISSNQFLQNEFSVFEKRTTVRNDMSYTGIYFYGKNTYFEFLPPGSAAGMPQGATGIAWGFEQSGAASRMSKRLKEKKYMTFDGPVTRKLDEEEIPWFQFLGIQPAHEKSTLSLFAMEYKPEFLQKWHADLPPEKPSISRGAILQRYAAKLANDNSTTTPLFQDIAEVHLELDPRQMKHVQNLLNAFNYDIGQESGQVVARGPDVVFRLKEGDRPGGIVAFQINLSRDANDCPAIRFGPSSELRFSGRTATWTFNSEKE